MSTIKLYGCFFIICTSICTSSALQSNATIPVNVGLVLDANTWIGKLGLSSISMALSDFYASHLYFKTRLVINTKDSKEEVIAAASAAVDLIENEEVKAIIGPQSSKQASFLMEVGHKYEVPMISFSAASPSLTSPQIPSPYLFRAAQNDAAQVQAISAIVQAFDWNQVVLIYSQGIYEEELIPLITKALLDENVYVSYHSVISPSTTNQQILQELQKLTTMSNKVFIVHLSPELGSHFFIMARKMGMMVQGYVWIITTRMGNYLTLMNSSVLDSMQGVIGLTSYIPKSEELEDFEARWKKKFQQENPSTIGPQMNVLGVWAYDAATALAVAVEKCFQKISASRNANATNFRVSQIGPNLREALSKTSFQGLVGDFNFVNGEANLSAFQIININGDRKRVVGYWTPQNGLIRKMDSRSMGKYSISKTNLGPIIWPGDSSSAPIGWYDYANTKKLRIGVPVKRNEDGFKEVIGYCMDVFTFLLEMLPYPVPYELIPAPKYDDDDDFHPGAYYDDLIRQIYLGEFDAVVGDVTIMAERSLYVDFTMPFTENGATFIVPTATNEQSKAKAWIFLKPLTWELWLTTGCFFVFIGFVVWVLEHPVNEEFRGSPAHQVSTSFWFSFSTLVFAQRERVRSNLARFVVIIWVFVVLILTQSYTANLATQMTVKQLRPSVKDVNQLQENGDSVGYQDGSYLYQGLKRMGFDDFKLKVYRNAQECDHLLKLGSQNGGIAAAFDEIPYQNVILTEYCSKYTTIAGSTYRTQGFGFVASVQAFRRGTPIVSDISRGILNLTEWHPDTMKAIEEKWFPNKTHCTQPSDEEDTSNRLNLQSFLGLFLIAGIASSLALIVHTAMIIHGRRRVFTQPNSNDSLWKKICTVFSLHYREDTNSYGSRNDREQISIAINEIHDLGTWIPEVNEARPSYPEKLEPYA